MTHSRPERTLFEWCSRSVIVLWGANFFNTTIFLLNSWTGPFKFVYPRLYGMSWRHSTVSMNPEFLAKFTLDGNVSIVVLIKWFYGETTPYTSPRLHFKLNAIHGHATWQHHSPFQLKLKIEKCRCQIARFTGGTCIKIFLYSNTFYYKYLYFIILFYILHFMLQYIILIKKCKRDLAIIKHCQSILRHS